MIWVKDFCCNHFEINTVPSFRLNYSGVQTCRKLKIGSKRFFKFEAWTRRMAKCYSDTVLRIPNIRNSKNFFLLALLDLMGIRCDMNPPLNQHCLFFMPLNGGDESMVAAHGDGPVSSSHSRMVTTELIQMSVQSLLR
jgi:hypothetical protein